MSQGFSGKGRHAMNYDAVIFDLFGTLVDSASQEVVYDSYKAPAALLGVDVEKFTSAWLDLRLERDSGKYGSTAGDIRHVCKTIGLHPDAASVDQIVKHRLDMYRSTQPRATVIDTMTRLRSAGVKIGLISDCGFELPSIWDSFSIAPLIDTKVFSCLEGVTKPNPRLYHLACERLSVQPSRCLYVGDGGSRELTGALAVGMHPVLIRVDYEHFMDSYREDALEWKGSVISDISEVLGQLGIMNWQSSVMNEGSSS
jgi:putative hydrolase of the HAD superfamily